MPYTGSDYLGSAMAMDKAVAKRIMDSNGIRTPAWRELRYTEADIPRLCEELPVPCAIKVVNGGSSIGVQLPDTREELSSALRDVLRYGDRVVVEEKIYGREMTVPVLGERALCPIEIVPPDGSSFDYVAKYQSGSAAAAEICPAHGLHPRRRRPRLVPGSQHASRHDACEPHPQGRRRGRHKLRRAVREDRRAEPAGQARRKALIFLSILALVYRFVMFFRGVVLIFS